MINNLKIGVKLYLSFGLVSLILLIVGVREYVVLHNLEDERFDLTQSYNMADGLMEAKYELRTDLWLLMEMLDADNTSTLNSLFQQHEQIIKLFDNELSLTLSIAEDNSWGMEYGNEKSSIIEIVRELEKSHNDVILPDYKKLKELIADGINDESIAEQNAVKIEDLDGEIDAVGRELLDQMEDAELIVESLVESAVLQSEKASEQAVIETIILLIVGLIFAMIISFIITRGITLPVRKGLDFARKIADGDLTTELNITQNDEIGQLAQALNRMSEKLKSIVADIQAGADQISNASQELSSTSQEMSQGSSEQASSAEEVSSSMEQMASNIQQNTDNAQQTEKISIKASGDIGEGKESVIQTVASMRNIAGKIGIISEIARQTNILALNAAVEAARAGEHGKGFAVVAEEVRKLAARSQEAAKEIDETSKNSVTIAEKSGKLLEEIVPDIERTAKLVQEIAAASVEQSSGADQVNSAIQQLNLVTQQNAAASEEMATSSEELASQANQLKEAISYFKI
ncbi:MAG: hypothetical protein C0599_09750 [Salinivirgaceae bacterium]|nr:MAG: hypothetical protein C0599_09750 [Salinivirgaceae bacterium]